MLDLVVLIQHIVINNQDRNTQYSVIQSVLGCSRHTAKKLMFAWIYRAEQGTLRKMLMEEITNSGV